jgi:hypothetical protein
VTKLFDQLNMNTRHLFRFISVVAIALALLVCGCSSRPAAADKLFRKGEFQKVVDKYPDLEIARRAEAKLAEKLLSEKQYESVIRQYPQTPAAYKAKLALAQQIFDAGLYMKLIDEYPFSPLVGQAKERLVDSLLANGQVDELLTRYPDSPKAKEIKEKQALEAFASAKKLRGAAKEKALEEIQQRYSGTSIYKDASEMLAKMRAPKNR